MPFIKLHRGNDTGESVGRVLVNPEQIIAISAGQTATELQKSDGRTLWVKETPDEVAVPANEA